MLLAPCNEYERYLIVFIIPVKAKSAVAILKVFIHQQNLPDSDRTFSYEWQAKFCTVRAMSLDLVMAEITATPFAPKRRISAVLSS